MKIFVRSWMPGAWMPGALFLVSALFASVAQARSTHLPGSELRLEGVRIEQVRCQTQTLQFRRVSEGTKDLEVCYINQLPEAFVGGFRPQDGHADLRTLLQDLKTSRVPVNIHALPDEEHTPSLFEARSLPREPLMSVRKLAY